MSEGSVASQVGDTPGHVARQEGECHNERAEHRPGVGVTADPGKARALPA